MGSISLMGSTQGESSVGAESARRDCREIQRDGCVRCVTGDCARVNTVDSRAGAATSGYVPGPHHLRSLADSRARRCSVPRGIFRRLIARESGWNPQALGALGEIGLGQLRPEFHGHPLLDLWDPRTNLSVSCAYLRRLYEATGSWRRALEAYHGGPNRSETTQQTRDYARDVMGDM